MAERVKKSLILLVIILLETSSTFTDLFMWDVKERTPLFEKNEGRGVAKKKTFFGTYLFRETSPRG